MEDNLFKNLHGLNSIEHLGNLLAFYKDKGYIQKVDEKANVGYQGKEKQFYFQYMITFGDEEKWIIHSTTSIRERINIQQWHSLHFKNIIRNIKKSIIVYPDSINSSELKNAERYYRKIINGTIFSAIDHVISLSELSYMIESKYMSDKSLGQQKALEGDNLEVLLVDILTQNSNVIKWNGSKGYETGYNYPYFRNILNSVGIPVGAFIKEINATRDIPKLPSGGKPKTDVFLQIRLMDDAIYGFTFSCKRSSSDWVSVHQYSAGKFIEVLGITDKRLQSALLEFQAVGGLRALSQQSTDILLLEMPKYNTKLAMWVYGGFGGEGDPNIHWARNVITLKNETSELRVIKLEDYVRAILDEDGHFGTPFKWTFASGAKGKSIQLKGKVI